MLAGLLTVVPVFAATFFAALIAPMLIGGWKGPLALGGEPMVAMLVLGAVPFTIAVNLADYVIRTRPQWLGVQRPGLAVEVAR